MENLKCQCGTGFGIQVSPCPSCGSHEHTSIVWPDDYAEPVHGERVGDADVVADCLTRIMAYCRSAEQGTVIRHIDELARAAHRALRTESSISRIFDVAAAHQTDTRLENAGRGYCRYAVLRIEVLESQRDDFLAKIKALTVER